MINQLLNKLLFIFKSILIVIYIILEELIWERFAEPIYDYIKELRVFKRLELLLRGRNRYIVLILFLFPFIVGELLGLYSAVVALKGYILFSVLLYIFKLIVISFSFWLFNIEKDKILSFILINYSYKKILTFISWIKTRDIFITTKIGILKIKRYSKELFIKLKECCLKL